MSENLISADRVLCLVKRDSDLLASCGEEQTVDDVIAIIKSAPAVDAVEVVRCSQCLYSTEEIWSTTKRYGERGTVKCCNPNSIAFNRLCLPRDFCRVGERRDDNAVD